MLNGKQQTICWHVDDLKVLHMDPDVNTEFLKALDKQFGYNALGNRVPCTT